MLSFLRILAFLLFLSTSMYAQIEVHPSSAYSLHFQIDEALVFRLQHHSPTAQRVYFLVKLKHRVEVLTLQSAPMMLTPGRL